jgi:hypothetical protein
MKPGGPKLFLAAGRLLGAAAFMPEQAIREPLGLPGPWGGIAADLPRPTSKSATPTQKPTGCLSPNIFGATAMKMTIDELLPIGILKEGPNDSLSFSRG